MVGPISPSSHAPSFEDASSAEAEVDLTFVSVDDDVTVVPFYGSEARTLRNLVSRIEAAIQTDPELMLAASSLETIDQRIAVSMSQLNEIDSASQENSQQQEAIATVRQAIQEASSDDNAKFDISGDGATIEIDGMTIAEYLDSMGVTADILFTAQSPGRPVSDLEPGSQISGTLLDNAAERLRLRGTEISRSRDLIMMQMQNDVSRRKQTIQLFTNLMKSLSESTESIVRNLG